MFMENLPSNGGLLEKGLDMLKDPEVSKVAKIGAVGIVAIGSIVYVSKVAIDAMNKS